MVRATAFCARVAVVGVVRVVRPLVLLDLLIESSFKMIDKCPCSSWQMKFPPAAIPISSSFRKSDRMPRDVSSPRRCHERAVRCS